VPRERKQKLKRRTDGRYACRYKNQWFYDTDPEECLRKREQFKADERRGRIAVYFVSEYAEKWLDRTYPNANPKTYKSVKIHLKTLINAIGDLPVSDVRPSDIKTIYSTHYRDLSNEYIKQAKLIYCALFDSAVSDGLITVNPARDRSARPHKGKSGGHRAITPQEREWILTKATDNRAHPVAMLMLYAGLRPQEAKAFHIDRDVDFINKTVTVRQTAHTDPDNAQKYTFTDEGKTERANRQVPLLPPLENALRGKHGYIITSAHGKPVTQETFIVAWDAYCHQIEREVNGMSRGWYGRTAEHKKLIAEGKPLPPWLPFDVVPYDLRHSYITMLRDLKPPIELHTAIRWAGHVDSKMILQIYDSVSDDRNDSEAQRLRESFLTTDLTTKP
jgi:integrase